MGPRVAWKTGGDYTPKQGNRELAITYDFSATASYLDDLLPELSSHQIEFVQSVFIDNSLNPNPLTIQFAQGPQQPIVAPAQSQGIYPVLMGGDIRYQISTTPSAALLVKLIFSNVKREFKTWGPISVTGNLTVPVVAYTKRSAAITGVAQVLMAANGARKAMIIEAPSANAASIFVALDGGVPSGTCYEIMPGGNLPDYFAVTQAAINIIGTVGDNVIAFEGQ